MKFVDFVNRNAIRTNVEADTKEDVIRAMASSTPMGSRMMLRTCSSRTVRR